MTTPPNTQQTKDFHLGDVLSITTGVLVSFRSMEGIYDILNFMTGDDLFTHQLPRATDECKPHLLEQFPELKEGSGRVQREPGQPRAVARRASLQVRGEALREDGSEGGSLLQGPDHGSHRDEGRRCQQGHRFRHLAVRLSNLKQPFRFKEPSTTPSPQDSFCGVSSF